MIMFLASAFALLMFGKPATLGTDSFPGLRFIFLLRHVVTLVEKREYVSFPSPSPLH